MPGRLPLLPVTVEQTVQIPVMDRLRPHNPLAPRALLEDSQILLTLTIQPRLMGRQLMALLLMNPHLMWCRKNNNTLF